MEGVKNMEQTCNIIQIQTQVLFQNQQKQTYQKKKKKWKIMFISLATIVTIYFVSLIIDVYLKPEQKYTRNVLFYPTFQLPIHFSWLGDKPMPTKYVERLKKIKFPYVLLGENDYAEFADFYNFDKNISVSKRNDAFRLRYLWKYGGIYADLDFIIDYQCLMMKLQGLNGTYYSKERNYLRLPVSSLMYASSPGDQLLDQVTKQLHDRQNQTTLKFVVQFMEQNYVQRMTSIDLDMCAYHEQAGTWVKDDPNPW